MAITKKLSKLDKIIDELQLWNNIHKPLDVMTRMGLFKFSVGADKDGILRQVNGQQGVPRTMFLSQHATNQLLDRLQYSRRLYGRLPDAYNTRNLNHLIKEHAKDYPIMLRIIDGDQVRALLSKRFRPLDNFELLTILKPQLVNDSVKWYFKDERTLHISILSPKKTTLKVGDIAQLGIHISNSEVGVRSVTIISYVYRLKCKNGLIGTSGGDIYRYRHVSDPEQIKRQVMDVVNSAQQGAAKIINALKAAFDKKIDEPEVFFKRVVKTIALTTEQANVVLDALQRDEQNRTNLFEVSQAIALIANNFERKKEGEVAYQLRQAAVRVLEMAVDGNGGKPSEK